MRCSIQLLPVFYSLQIRELEKEKNSLEDDRQVLKSQLESEILNLKTQNLSSTQKFKAQISSLERSKKDLADSLRDLEEKSKLVLGESLSLSLSPLPPSPLPPPSFFLPPPSSLLPPPP
jgi:hypothetical protein